MISPQKAENTRQQGGGEGRPKGKEKRLKEGAREKAWTPHVLSTEINFNIINNLERRECRLLKIQIAFS